MVHERLMHRLTNVWKMSAAVAAEAGGTEDDGGMHGKQMIRQVFDDIDEDGSGFLDRHEFQSALEALGVYLSRRVFDRLMRVIDVDHSGTVDYDEFIALVYDDNDTLLQVLRSKVLARYASELDDKGEAAHAVSRELKVVFTKLSETGTVEGELHVDGFTKALEALGVELSPHLLEQLLSIFDSDGSGTIDFDEFQQSMMGPDDLALLKVPLKPGQNRVSAFQCRRGSADTSAAAMTAFAASGLLAVRTGSAQQDLAAMAVRRGSGEMSSQAMATFKARTTSPANLTALLEADTRAAGETLTQFAQRRGSAQLNEVASIVDVKVTPVTMVDPISQSPIPIRQRPQTPVRDSVTACLVRKTTFSDAEMVAIEKDLKLRASVCVDSGIGAGPVTPVPGGKDLVVLDTTDL